MDFETPYHYTILVARKKDTETRDVSLLANRNDVSILFAETGTEAIQLYSENPEISLVIVNSDLQSQNGYETTLKIRNLNKQLPIILLVNYNSLETFRLANLVGCSQLLQNPVKAEEMYSIANKYILKYSSFQKINKLID